MASEHQMLSHYLERMHEGHLYDAGELVTLGINMMALRRLYERGLLESPAHGIYIKPGYEPLLLDDHLVVSKRAPNVVFNLYTAARIHDITQVEPIDLWLGLPPTHKNPPTMGGNFHLDIQALRWTRQEDVEIGVETISSRGVDLKFTNPERTVVDMWRYSDHNPSLKNQHSRITEENLLQCVGAYLEKNDGRTASLAKMAVELRLSERAIDSFFRFVKTFSGAYSATRVF